MSAHEPICGERRVDSDGVVWALIDQDQTTVEAEYVSGPSPAAAAVFLTADWLRMPTPLTDSSERS